MDKVRTKYSNLQQSNVDFHVNTFINDCFHEKRTEFAAFCAVCPYNFSTGFERNYFSSTNCCCYAENYMFFCSYCSWLKHCLNYKVNKPCILVENVKKNPFDIHPIGLYLHEKITASPLCYFDSIKNEVIVRLDSIQYGNRFVSRKYCRFLIN